jgi:putative ABC transport system substrate-binding protein
MLARLNFLLIGLWLFVFAGFSAHANTTVVIVSSEASPAYVDAAQAMVNELERGGISRYDMLQLTALEFSKTAPMSPKLFVALGVEASRVLAKAEVQAPIFCTLLPRSSFERVLQESARQPSTQFSALYLDQPLSRQLDLIRIALPAVQHVGVLWGPESKRQETELKVLARAKGFELSDATVTASDLLFPSLKKVLVGADVLLALADPQVFNSNSVQNILLSSFRAKVPLVAFSPAYVRAGALFSLAATPAQMGQQAGSIALGVLQGKALMALPVYSRDFSVTVNEHVARSFGLKLDAAVLTTRLRSLESGR